MIQVVTSLAEGVRRKCQQILRGCQRLRYPLGYCSTLGVFQDTRRKHVK